MHALLGFGQALDMIAVLTETFGPTLTKRLAGPRVPSKNLNPEKPLATHTFNL